MVCPAPGVPETHPLVIGSARAGVPLRSEIDLAYEWEQDRARRAAADAGHHRHRRQDHHDCSRSRSCAAAGVRTAALGNTEVPLVAALDATGDDESTCSSSSAAASGWPGPSAFRAEAAVWLNLAPDHQNWHASMATYEAAKARIWEHQRRDRRGDRVRRRPDR